MQGLVEAASLACALGLDFISAAFVRTLANFTGLHEPQSMRMPHAHALRQLLTIPDRVGAHAVCLFAFPLVCSLQAALEGVRMPPAADHS